MTNQSTNTAAVPSHRLYCVTGNDKASHWTEVGAAWPNKDGQGFSLRFTAVPLSGRLVMRTITERSEQQAELTGEAA